jgi:protein-tyrosine-phosphatase
MSAARILFICSGNTCRSPLAAAIAAARLGAGGVACASAGLDAWDGSSATEESRDQAAERGLDLEGHRSRAVDGLSLDGVDWVIGMTYDHVRRFRMARPDYRGRLGLLGLPGVDLARGGDPAVGEQVADPYRRGTYAAYAAMGEQVDRLVGAWTPHLLGEQKP